MYNEKQIDKKIKNILKIKQKKWRVKTEK
jgi:hypothetical protein